MENIRDFVEKQYKMNCKKWIKNKDFHHLTMLINLFTCNEILDDDIIKAALLCDIMENTYVIYSELYENFGNPIMDIVMECVDDGSLTREEQVEKCKTISLPASIIKIVTIINNINICLHKLEPTDISELNDYLEFSESLVYNLPNYDDLNFKKLLLLFETMKFYAHNI